jgi:hypothetical protein
MPRWSAASFSALAEQLDAQPVVDALAAINSRRTKDRRLM